MIEGSGNIGVEFGPGGLAIADNSRSPRLFKIVSGSNPYTADEVALVESDGSTLATGNYAVTAAQKVLWESAGVTTVAADTIVEATPNQFGTGFYFSAPASGFCDDPIIFRVQVGTSFSTTTISGTAAVTGIEQRFRDVTVDENGCLSVGAPYCVDATDAACSDGEDSGSPKWWCISGVCYKVYDGITPPGGAGPYTTAADCDSNCAGAGDGEPGGDLTCCDPDLTSVPVLRATLDGGEGTIDLTWDGSTYWQGSKTLTCGEALHIRYSEACVPEYSCDGSNWQPVTTGVGSLDCDVGAGTFSDTNPHDCDMNDTNAGCAAGSCGTIQITEVATV